MCLLFFKESFHQNEQIRSFTILWQLVTLKRVRRSVQVNLNQTNPEFSLYFRFGSVKPKSWTNWTHKVIDFAIWFRLTQSELLNWSGYNEKKNKKLTLKEKSPKYPHNLWNRSINKIQNKSSSSWSWPHLFSLKCEVAGCRLLPCRSTSARQYSCTMIELPTATTACIDLHPSFLKSMSR